MQILQRYLLREMTVNFLGVTLVLFAILFINQVGTVLARAAQLQYQSGFVLELIGLGAAQNFALLLPIGLLLGIVLAFGRLYHDSEMAAAQACGVGVVRVAAAVWLLALPITALIVLINFELAPRAVCLAGQKARAGVDLSQPRLPGWLLQNALVRRRQEVAVFPSFILRINNAGHRAVAHLRQESRGSRGISMAEFTAQCARADRLGAHLSSIGEQ